VAQRVLVVDDYADARDLLSIILQQAGYDVFTAADGVEAVDAVKQFGPDLVLMDIFMPRMDGVEATQAIRKLPHNASLPVVAYTAKPNVLRDQPGLFDDICAKPCEPAELLTKLERLVPRA
jgi:CheY-like chemotaxis protein